MTVNIRIFFFKLEIKYFNYTQKVNLTKNIQQLFETFNEQSIKPFENLKLNIKANLKGLDIAINEDRFENIQTDKSIFL